jgi:ribA/ribD-fused uncharacterized protein
VDGSAFPISLLTKLISGAGNSKQANTRINTKNLNTMKKSEKRYLMPAQPMIPRYSHRSLRIDNHQDWEARRVGVMEEIVRAKLSQHPHILKKLKETGDKEIIENSPDDYFWGWGADHSGQNIHGKIWMKLREEIKQNEK